MVKHVTFFHGGGTEADYEADAKLVDSLQLKLGPGYLIRYPLLPNDGTSDLGRRKQISAEISASHDDVIVVGHSLGASMVLACLSEMKIDKKVAAIFLLATPFWSGDEDWVEAFKLQPDFANNLSENTPYIYHGRDYDSAIHQLSVIEAKRWLIPRDSVGGNHSATISQLSPRPKALLI